MAISPETAATTRSIFSMLSRTPRRSTSTPWTLRGRRKRQPSSTRTTERGAKQEERRSPLTDSNRRPPPYHGGALPTELRGQCGHSRRSPGDGEKINRNEACLLIGSVPLYPGLRWALGWRPWKLEQGG